MKDELVMIRFRDLVTELGGTIGDHRKVLISHGEVWWGWFMQPYETVPRCFFGSLLDRIEKHGPLRSFLFDTGQGLLYECMIADIKVAPTERGMQSPNFERSPEYYHRGRYPAWFLLRNIDDSDLLKAKLVYNGFPTRPEKGVEYTKYLGKILGDLDELRDKTKVTLWVVAIRQPRRKKGFNNKKLKIGDGSN